MSAPATMPAIRAERLTREAFAPFGTLAAHQGEERRHYLPQALDHTPDAPEVRFWISRSTTTVALPLTVTFLEHHPYSAQTFLPLSGQRYLVAVAPSQADGAPDLNGLRAFVAQPGQGICYHRKVWHYSMAVFDAPSEFAVFMHLTGRGDDDVFVDLPHPVAVLPPADGSLKDNAHDPL